MSLNTMTSIRLEEQPPRSAPLRRIALLELGFRPFYLLAALFAALAVPLWVLVLDGIISLPLPGLWWHAHEMIFGFAVAVIIGFLFTAGRNWTGLPTPRGSALAALALLWVCGRLAFGLHAGIMSAFIDISFLPAAAVALAQVLWQAKSRRNYFIVALLGVLALCNLGFHLARLGWFDIDPLAPLHLALGLIIVLESAIAGRVIPAFTMSALGRAPGGRALHQNEQLNKSAIALTALALLCWAAGVTPVFAVPLAAIAALLQFARWIGWRPLATRTTPILWILHLSYLWIPLGLALLAAAQADLLPRGAGVHALGIGATGGLVIGMITRTALGHTGRMLVAGPVETGAYVLVHLAAAARVLTLVALPAAALVGVHIAALAWSLAFALYLLRYAPFLIRARADGQPG